MSNIIRNTINKIDSLYHQKNIFSVLKGLNLQTAIDVGAHKGEFLSYLLKLNSIKNIHAFEPQKKIFNELEQKFLSNDLIILNNFAISDESGFKNIKINELTSTSTFSEISANSIWAKLKNAILFSKNSIVGNYEVQTIKLDNYIKEKKINNIDLLKIDTEGHELNVLKGSEKSFDDKIIKYILIEVNLTKMYKNYKIEDVENFLQRKNYKLVKKFKFPLLNFEDRLYVSDKF